MTKFIIHGGNTGEINDDNYNFFAEMTRELKKSARILLCYFSRRDDEIARCFAQDKKRFIQSSDNRNLMFEIARPDTLKTQLARADVFYMRGGETDKLIKNLSRTKNLKRLFNGKVIAGSSAGAYALARYYWNHNGDGLSEFSKGLGILKFNVLCHYGQGRDDIVQKFIKYKKDIPLVALPNYKWAVIYK